MDPSKNTAYSVRTVLALLDRFQLIKHECNFSLTYKVDRFRFEENSNCSHRDTILERDENYGNEEKRIYNIVLLVLPFTRRCYRNVNDAHG